MRDGQVYQMQEANARRSALLLSQWEFLETRQRAFELVVKCSSVLERIRYVFSPLAFFKAVDAQQFELLEDAKRKSQAAAERGKAEAMKPRLTIVGTARNGSISGPAGVVPMSGPGVHRV